MVNATDPLTAARAEALFISNLSAYSFPTSTEVTAAIRHAVRTYGGIRGCAGEVAAAYGERPEIAAPRMRWARQMVETVYGCRARAHAGRRPRTPISALQQHSPGLTADGRTQRSWAFASIGG